MATRAGKLGASSLGMALSYVAVIGLKSGKIDIRQLGLRDHDDIPARP